MIVAKINPLDQEELNILAQIGMLSEALVEARIQLREVRAKKKLNTSSPNSDDIVTSK